ncbi:MULTISPECIES: hypothetical protein [Dactylosporangium]|uniref:Uncharacterized protein n=2 Tax=Dactylosporangium TaxID=35753 RepID=A0A9W6KRJ3_9ACTN|nr:MULTISPECIES: hypothetical protein [Dactylosporangium]UAB98710.1 hypothetical protein Dvina_11885 [Dactylosporangium vinaceum]UWZ46964.1 hypothetical protein Dmats_11470 [Dactylosporangium matsuzakiense]GLL06856.1 hypothetical protein GCM10017581_086060 [Dactylosporangium matsuzakiense]
MRAQPRGARGTVGHPYSALNLRLLLAAFGFVTSTVLGALSLAAGFVWLAVALWVLAATALADSVVVELRRRARIREGGGRGSLFE